MSPIPSLALTLMASAVLAQTILRKPETVKDKRIHLYSESTRGSKALERAAAKIKRGTPVDDLQAKTLARVYFKSHYGACGGVGQTIDKGSFWLFHTAFGYSGNPWVDIRVDKRTGRVSEGAFPTKRVR